MKSAAQQMQPPISPDQYQRVFQTIYSSLDGRANTELSCIFFACAGAVILSDAFNIKCRPVAGAALLNIGDSSNTVITFGKFHDGILKSDRSAFHCWVETEQHAIDFMSPIYRENLISRGYLSEVPRKSFMKRLSDMVETLNQLDVPYGYALQHDEDLTESLFGEFMSKDLSMDLLTACTRWYRPYPQPMKPRTMASESGVQFQFALRGPNIDGQW